MNRFLFVLLLLIPLGALPACGDDEDSPDAGEAEIIIAKQRNGPTGTVKLQFEKRYARFHNLSGREPPPPTAGFDGGPEPPF